MKFRGDTIVLWELNFTICLKKSQWKFYRKCLLQRRKISSTLVLVLAEPSKYGICQFRTRSSISFVDTCRWCAKSDLFPFITFYGIHSYQKVRLELDHHLYFAKSFLVIKLLGQMNSCYQLQISKWRHHCFESIDPSVNQRENKYMHRIKLLLSLILSFQHNLVNTAVSRISYLIDVSSSVTIFISLKISIKKCKTYKSSIIGSYSCGK